MTMKRREFELWTNKRNEPLETRVEETTESGESKDEFREVVPGGNIFLALRFLSSLDRDQVYAIYEDSSARIIIYYKDKDKD